MLFLSPAKCPASLSSCKVLLKMTNTPLFYIVSSFCAPCTSPVLPTPSRTMMAKRRHTRFILRTEKAYSASQLRACVFWLSPQATCSGAWAHVLGLRAASFWVMCYAQGEDASTHRWWAVQSLRLIAPSARMSKVSTAWTHPAGNSHPPHAMIEHQTA